MTVVRTAGLMAGGGRSWLSVSTAAGTVSVSSVSELDSALVSVVGCGGEGLAVGDEGFEEGVVGYQGV